MTQPIDPDAVRALEIISAEHERRCLETVQMDAGDDASWVRCTKNRHHSGNMHTALNHRWWTT